MACTQLFHTKGEEHERLFPMIKSSPSHPPEKEAPDEDPRQNQGPRHIKRGIFDLLEKLSEKTGKPEFKEILHENKLME